MINEMLVITLQQYVILQLDRDILDEFSQLPVYGKKFKYELIKLYELHNSLRKKLNRQLTKEELGAFEEFVAKQADILEKRQDYVKVMLKDAMVNKIPYEQIDAAILVCMLCGYTDILQTVNRRVSGKNNSVFSQMIEILESIDRGMSFKLLNGKEPEQNVAVEPLVSMFIELRKNIISDLEKGNIVWKSKEIV